MYILTINKKPCTIAQLFEHEFRARGGSPEALDEEDTLCYIACTTKAQVKHYYSLVVGNWDERSPTIDVSKFDVVKD